MYQITICQKLSTIPHHSYVGELSPCHEPMNDELKLSHHIFKSQENFQDYRFELLKIRVQSKILSVLTLTLGATCEPDPRTPDSRRISDHAQIVTHLVPLQQWVAWCVNNAGRIYSTLR